MASEGEVSNIPVVGACADADGRPAPSDSAGASAASVPPGGGWELVEEGCAIAPSASDHAAAASTGSALGPVLEAGAADPSGAEEGPGDGSATPAAGVAEDLPGCGAPPPEQNPELDLCFLCDCTGSMGHYIRSAQQNIRDIVETIKSSHGATVRFGLISYRDHPPQDHTYVTQVHPFTEDVQEMACQVSTMSAAGGGDGPEAVTAALADALELPWRPNATKIIILIADAPPHGLEPGGDGFPNGDPEGRDPLEIGRSMAAEGIVCYCVGCEPALGHYHFARDFMCSLAEITGGQAVALSSAALLAKVIVNGSAEEISLTRLEREVERELESVRAAANQSAEVLSDADCARVACLNLQARSVRTTQMVTDGAYENRSHSVWHGAKAQTLAGAKLELTSSMPVPKAALPCPVPGGMMFMAPGGGWGGPMSMPGGMMCMAPDSGPVYAMPPPPAAGGPMAMPADAMSPPPAAGPSAAPISFGGYSPGMMAAPGMPSPSGMPHTPCVMSAPATSGAPRAEAARQQVSTLNAVREDLISVGQVQRLMQRKSRS